eukprot:CAMPEP_0171279548 /NCGR_PEP_ID=MMETSP0790-20130122/65442_1 /TAXON_ID=2925 /ORGANISM="Alexandrium catenella, Strain OF101" /LENGTH=144 /DNA_ID=CAMNT_0011748741 /DNA_START=20 /DNA_END=451 /DNA_ORIENTATION=+
MSLGWLTESSLIPREPKPIEGVGTASLLNLQAAVYDRERRGPFASTKRRRRAEEAKAKNAGVEERNAKDEQNVEEGGVSLARVAARLAEKALKYEALAGGRAGHDGEALVDFERKRWEANEVGAGIPPPEEEGPNEEERAELAA